MKAEVNQDLCIACGLCISMCPDIFELDDTGKAAVIREPEAGEEDITRDAAISCPVDAIAVTE
ncbi:MAG: ferredoxin [Lachnospiraceae bacterium]|nr:ferredoxin [Lachnospiraceae bacterium]